MPERAFHRQRHRAVRRKIGEMSCLKVSVLSVRCMTCVLRDMEQIEQAIVST
jgi:hypothetical protein